MSIRSAPHGSLDWRADCSHQELKILRSDRRDSAHNRIAVRAVLRDDLISDPTIKRIHLRSACFPRSAELWIVALGNMDGDIHRVRHAIGECR